MAWEQPLIVEIQCGLEVTAYAPAPEGPEDEFNAEVAAADPSDR